MRYGVLNFKNVLWQWLPLKIRGYEYVWDVAIIDDFNYVCVDGKNLLLWSLLKILWCKL